MKKIIIGFSKPKNKFFPIFSWLIRLYERTPYSHTYIRWQTHWGVCLCYQASGTAINFMGEATFKKHISPVEEFEFQVNEDQWDKLLGFCVKYVGADYALLDALKIPLWDLGLAQPKKDDPWSQYCAELVIRALGEIEGKQLTLDADRVTLKQVYDFVKEKHAAGASL
jgi:hypothetical protein